jgi:hypothetical protein
VKDEKDLEEELDEFFLLREILWKNIIWIW